MFKNRLASRFDHGSHATGANGISNTEYPRPHREQQMPKPFGYPYHCVLYVCKPGSMSQHCQALVVWQCEQCGGNPRLYRACPFSEPFDLCPASLLHRSAPPRRGRHRIPDITPAAPSIARHGRVKNICLYLRRIQKEGGIAGPLFGGCFLFSIGPRYPVGILQQYAIAVINFYLW